MESFSETILELSTRNWAFDLGLRVLTQLTLPVWVDLALWFSICYLGLETRGWSFWSFCQDLDFRVFHQFLNKKINFGHQSNSFCKIWSRPSWWIDKHLAYFCQSETIEIRLVLVDAICVCSLLQIYLSQALLPHSLHPDSYLDLWLV